MATNLNQHIFDPYDDVRLHEAAERGEVLLPLPQLAHTARQAREMAEHEAKRAVNNHTRFVRVMDLMGVHDHGTNRRSVFS